VHWSGAGAFSFIDYVRCTDRSDDLNELALLLGVSKVAGVVGWLQAARVRQSPDLEEVDSLLFIVVVLPGQRKRKKKVSARLSRHKMGRELTNA
jgi:hypothetical protein